MSQKRQRESYTVSEKLSMVKKFQSENPPTSIRKFSIKYGIPANTFKHWVQIFENGVPDELKSLDSQTRKRIRPGKFPKLEKQVIDYIRVESINNPENTITWLALREKCNEWIKSLMTEKEIEASSFSNGWLLRVLRRNSLTQYIDGISNINPNNLAMNQNNLLDGVNSQDNSQNVNNNVNNNSIMSYDDITSSFLQKKKIKLYDNDPSLNTFDESISYDLALNSMKNVVKYVTNNNMIDITEDVFKIYNILKDSNMHMGQNQISNQPNFVNNSEQHEVSLVPNNNPNEEPNILYATSHHSLIQLPMNMPIDDSVNEDKNLHANQLLIDSESDSE